jgi:hypothetical protein
LDSFFASSSILFLASSGFWIYKMIALEILRVLASLGLDGVYVCLVCHVLRREAHTSAHRRFSIFWLRFDTGGQIRIRPSLKLDSSEPAEVAV